MIKQIKKQIMYVTCSILALGTLLLTANYASPKQEKSNTNQQTQIIKFVDQSKLISNTLFGKRFKNEMESLNIQLKSEMSEIERRGERLHKELMEQDELLKSFAGKNEEGKDAIKRNIEALTSELKEIEMTFRERQRIYQEAATGFEKRVSEIFHEVVARASKKYSEAHYR